MPGKQRDYSITPYPQGGIIILQSARLQAYVYRYYILFKKRRLQLSSALYVACMYSMHVHTYIRATALRVQQY